MDSESVLRGAVLRCDDRSKTLESSVFNHVSLGQWEAAKASLSCLAGDTADRDNARELLKILVLESATYWSESSSIPSPHHLSWLALETYKTLFPDDKDQLPGYIQELVEFRLLLFAANDVPSFSTRVASDLCNYHSVHALKVPGSQADSVPQLQTPVFQFIHDVITSLDPALGHALITSLTVRGRLAYLANNEALQMIYIDIINETLESLAQARVAETSGHDSSYDSQYESDHPSSKTREGLVKDCEKKVSFVYTLLSLIDPSNEMGRITNRLDRIFHTLLKSSFKIGGCAALKFDSGRIYACLLGRSSPFLINRLHGVEEYLRMNQGPDYNEAAVGNSKSHDGEIPPRSIHHEWNERFYQALYDHKHLLESVIDNGLQLVFTGKLPELSRQMMQLEYVPLRPVLLLLGWDRYSAAGSGKELLDSLWPMEVSMKQSLLFDGCCKLAFQVELVQWCLEKARPHVHAPSLLTINRACDMFKGLETHSTLYVLHHSTPLASLDPAEVVHILKMRPKVPSLSGRSGSVTPPPQFSREATPMKQLSESDTSPVPSPMFGTGIGQKSFPATSHSILKPEQERDIAIYRSFCALRLVMDAIWNSVQLASHAHPMASSTGPTSPRQPASQTARGRFPLKAARKLDMGSGDQPGDKSDGGAASSKTAGSDEPLQGRLYRELVLDKLHEAKVYLSLIHPLNYRLEVLENMFSLLFLTSEEIKQPKVSEGVEGTPLGSVGGVLSSVTSMDSMSSAGAGGDGVASALSSIALIKSQHTFLVDEDVTSDLLDMLKDCIFELRAAKFALTQQSEATVGKREESPELSPSTTVKSSVPHTSLFPRSSKLEQLINEARWRLKLVSSKHGLLAGGTSPAMAMKVKGQPAACDLLSSSDDSVFELSDSEEEKDKEIKMATRKRGKKPPSEVRGKDTPRSRLSPLPPEHHSDGKSPNAGFSIGDGPSSILASQLSSPAPRPQSITPKSRRSLSPAPSRQRHSSASSGPGSRAKGGKAHPRGSRHASPAAGSVHAQSSGGKSAPSSQLPDDGVEYAADVEEKSPQVSSRKKRLRSRSSQTSVRKRRGRKIERSESGFLKNSVVCKMLASPGSLLRMCLKHGNYHKAKEVVKMFGMEGQLGEALITFSEDFETVSSELSRRPAQATHSTSPSTKSTLKHVTSQAPSQGKTNEGSRRNFSSEASPSASISLQAAILNATSSSEPLDCLHRLLAPSNISKMLFSGDKELEKVAVDSALLRRLSDHVPSIIMLDLVCSGKVEGRVAKRIVEEAVSRSQDVVQSLYSRGASMHKLKRSLSNGGTSEGLANGPFLLLHTFYEVVGHFVYPGTLHSSVFQHPYGSPHSLLTALPHHLDVSSLTQSKSFADSLREAREKLEYTICQKQSELSSSTPEILMDLSQGAGGSHDTSSSSPKHGKIATIFDEVVRALSGTPEFLSSAMPSSGKDRCLMRRPTSTLRLPYMDDSPGHLRVGVAYVRQFSRYLVKLVELLIKCLGVGRSESTFKTMVVSVLREGPSHLLGWLVFEQGIQPQRLEAMMADFPQLRIVDILVKCCSPLLPSNAAVVSKQALLTSPPVIALNNYDVTATPTDPCDLSHMLLDKLISVLKKSAGSAPSQGGVVTPDDLVQIYESQEIQKVLRGSAQLAVVDLSQLDTPIKRLVFYSNVTNLLYAHALMAYFVSLSHTRGSGGHPNSLTENEVRMFPSIQSSRILQFTYFTKIGYLIGQLGLVSCFDLHHTILRRGLTTPTLIKGAAFKARLKPVKPDPWSVYAPPTPDPRLVYVVHDGRVSSPLPVALTVSDFEATVKAAEHSSINSSIVINAAKKQVCLPEWLYDNRDHLGELIWEEGSVPSGSTPFGHLSDVSFLNYIQSHLDKDRADWLKPYADVTDMAKRRKITFAPQADSLKLGYKFVTSSKSSPRGSPKMKRRGLARELSRRELSHLPSFEEEPSLNTRHSFTPDTLAFVKKRSPLISAVVHLVCPTPQTSTTSKTGKAGFEEDTIKSIRDFDGKSEPVLQGEQETSVKLSLLQSLRGKAAKPSGSPTHKRTTSVDEQRLVKQDPWRQRCDEVLSQFEGFPPMKRYLISRLTSFETVIQWDVPHPPSETRKSADERDFPVSLRRLAALPTNSEEVGVACSFVMTRLVEEGRLSEAVKFLSSEAATRNGGRVKFLKEMAICCLFVNDYTEMLSRGPSEEDSLLGQHPVCLLSQLSDMELASRLTLASLHNWPVGVCVDMLSFCFHHIPPSSILAPVISEKLDRMRVYSQVMLTCKSPLRGYESERAWKSWSELAKDTADKPGFVMDILLTTKEFDLIRKWVEVHKLEAKFSQQIEVEYLFDLLEGHNPDPIAAHQVLDGIADDKMALKVCEALLDRTDLETSLFVLHYMLTRLSHCIAMNRSHYSNRLLGAKALLCLPADERKTYEEFMLHPLLLVEALLINSRIEWAGQVIRQLRANEHLADISLADTPILERRLALPGVMGEERDGDPFTTLLMFYCDKALEFPQSAIVLSTPAETAAPSLAATCPPSPGAGSIAPAPSLGASQVYHGAPKSPPPRTAPFDLYGQFPPMTPRQTTYVPKKRTSSITTTLPALQEAESEGEGSEFHPPSHPPSKNSWESDSSTRVCRVCKQVYFNMFVRRHHCRRCGRVVCADCSNRTAVVRGYSQPVRVCNDCYPHCSPSSQLPSDEGQPHMPAADGLYEPDPGFPPLSPTHLHHWQLIPNDTLYNQNIRKAFYYERTPNTTLFISLLDLLDSKKLAAAFILDCCRTVSVQLMPDSTHSDEIDHNFVIELIQNLLLNAKLRFANSSDSAGVELCDTYLSRVELLHLLVTSQCSKIPSLQELTNPDLARRVRDRLIQDDRFSLAMEVSTKCQLDASAVWSAWGMMSLKSGDFKTAREKFIRCFQVSSQSKLASSGGQNLQLLHRIVDQIEQYPLSVTGRQAQHGDDWSSVLTGSMALSNRMSNECDLDLYRFNECVYYLRTYGNHTTLVSFYVRHCCWFEAARHIMDNRCSTELFVDHFWVPALKTGQITEVEGHLKSLDASLEAWHGYLTAACRYFTQKGLFHVLYHTQLLMNDQIRAGMTCTKFFVGFSGRSTTVSELSSRLHYLESARNHFQAALDAKTHPFERSMGGRSGRSHPESQRRAQPGAKTMSGLELEKHLATIALQVKVTKFLAQNAPPATPLHSSNSHMGGGGAEASLTSPSGWGKPGGTTPPTLFGSGHARAEVAVLVVTLSQDVIEGNSLAREIIQMYKLPMTDVYCSVSRTLAAKQQYNDIRLLLQCMQKMAQTRSHSVEVLCDDIIMAAIKVSNQAKETRQVDKLIQLLTSDRSKIKAFVQCGKLKNAYLVAIKSRLVDEVRNISEIAGKAGQIPVRDICEKWLAQQKLPPTRGR